MSIVKRNNLFFPSLVNDVFGPDWFGGVDKLHTSIPAVNIKENEIGFELQLAIPGAKKEDFKIEIDNEVLTISSEGSPEDNDEKERFTRKEFSYTAFKRVFTLPKTVDGSKIDATYENGILNLVLPKKEEALPKPKRLIEIG